MDIQAKLREIFPAFGGEIIRDDVLDRRLRMLDLRCTDYFSRSVDGFWWGRVLRESESEG